MDSKRFTAGLFGGAVFALLASASSASAVPVTTFSFTDLGVTVSGAVFNRGDNADLNPDASIYGTSGGFTATFAGGLPDASGIFVSSQGDAATPYGDGDTTHKYFSADGSGGLVTLKYSAPQNSLFMIWGTVDTETGRNLIAFNNGFSIDGNFLNSAAGCNGCISSDGNQDVVLSFKGFTNSFNQVAFSDSGNPAFEFAVTAVPEISTWGMMILGFFGLGFFGYRKSKASGSSFRIA
jgi:hypothetical protein